MERDNRESVKDFLSRAAVKCTSFVTEISCHLNESDTYHANATFDALLASGERFLKSVGGCGERLKGDLESFCSDDGLLFDKEDEWFARARLSERFIKCDLYSVYEFVNGRGEIASFLEEERSSMFMLADGGRVPGIGSTLKGKNARRRRDWNKCMKSLLTRYETRTQKRLDEVKEEDKVFRKLINDGCIADAERVALLLDNRVGLNKKAGEMWARHRKAFDEHSLKLANKPLIEDVERWVGERREMVLRFKAESLLDLNVRAKQIELVRIECFEWIASALRDKYEHVRLLSVEECNMAEDFFRERGELLDDLCGDGRRPKEKAKRKGRVGARSTRT